MDDKINKFNANQGVDFAIKHNLSALDNFAFQGFFTSPGGVKRLDGLVNAVRTNAGDAPITALEILNPNESKRNAFDKTAILDIKAVDEKGDLYDVEVQTTNQPLFRERVLYYWSRVFSEQIKEGEDYRRLHRAIGVVLETFPIHKAEPNILADVVDLQWRFYPKEPYSDYLKLYFVNVCPVFPNWEEGFRSGKMVDWVKLLNFPSKTSVREMEQAAQYSPDIEEALRAAKIFFGNREAQLVYEAQWRADLDRRYFEYLRNEQRDAERDVRRDAQRDVRRDAQRDAERDAKRDRERDAVIEAQQAARFNALADNKRGYIARRLARCWNVDLDEANDVLKCKTDYDELNEISEKMDFCQSYEDFLKLL